MSETRYEAVESREPKQELAPDTWRCCCGTFSNEHVKYLVQIAFGASIMLFSMVQIIRNDGDVTVYYSMLSGTMGLFLPSPGMKK
jgi:hypothetical protein